MRAGYKSINVTPEIWGLLVDYQTENNLRNMSQVITKLIKDSGKFVEVPAK